MTARSGPLVIACLVALSHPLAADPNVADEVPTGGVKLRNFGAADGLTNPAITSIAQDGDGLLWIGTDDGVYRFDGQRFTRFGLADGLVSNLIAALASGPSGAICAGALDGVVCWDGARFSQAGLGGVPAGTSVTAMVSFAGRLWVGTDAGLRVQDAGSLVPAPGWPGAPSDRVGALWADERGLLVGRGATVELTTGDRVWRSLGELGLGGKRVEGVLRDREGAVWIRSAASLVALPARGGRAIELGAGLPASVATAGAPVSMAMTARGEVVLVSDAGLVHRRGAGWEVFARTRTPAHTVFVDREGTIWTSAAGLYQLRGRGVVEHHDAATGLPGDEAWAFQRDPEGRLWIGTDRCLARAVSGRWQCLPGTENRVVRSMAFAPQGGVFVAGSPADLRYVAPDGEVASLKLFDLPADHAILALAVTPDGDLWVATRAGLFRLPGAEPGPLERVAVPGLAPDARFPSLAVIGNQLWTATVAGGLAVLDRGVWHRFDARDGLRGGPMRYVAARADGRICASYQEPLGITCFRYRNDGLTAVEHLGPDDGLSSGRVDFLGEDLRRRLWIGSGSGVDVVTAQGIDHFLVDHFDEDDGLAGNAAAATAFFLDRDGSVWLGASGGASHVLAQYYKGPPAPPRTSLVAGRLGNEVLRPAAPPLEVAHDHSSLVLELAASTLLDPRRVSHATRLSPLESVWSPTQQREIRYPALPPGSYRFEVRSRVGSGSFGPVTGLAFSVAPPWWETGWFVAGSGLAGVVGLGLAIAWWTRLRTRQLHAGAEASFRSVIDLMPELIAMYRDRVLVYPNLTSRVLLGLDPDAEIDWTEVDIFERVHPDDRGQVEELIDRVEGLAPQQASELIELRLRSADGSWRSCEVWGMAVEVASQPTLIISGRDVTERSRLRAQLAVADRMTSLGTLAAGMAHEINNPLAYVTSSLEVAAEVLHGASGATSDDPTHARAQAEAVAAIDQARGGTERVGRIVQGLRLLGQSDEEKRVPVALPEVLDAAIRLTGNEVRHRAQLVCELGPVPLVVADRSRLTQVFVDLLVNAAHAIAEGSSDGHCITVRTRTDSHGRAVVEIEDTGAGIPSELLPRVFDPFFTTRDVGGGTGLGLSICHGIVTALGGEIAIESTRQAADTSSAATEASMNGSNDDGDKGAGKPAIDGADRRAATGTGVPTGRGSSPAIALDRPTRPGTVVRVMLPPAPELVVAPPAAAVPIVAATGARRHRVMLVDDEPLIAQTMERLLRRDCDVTIALCGRDALAHITGGTRFDAIVSDVMMPNMTGIELLEELRRVAADQAARLIFLSGGAFGNQTRERLASLGVKQLEKPISAKELRANVFRIAAEASPLVAG